MYIRYAAVWGISVRKATKMRFWFLYTFLSVHLPITTGEMLNTLQLIWIFLIFTVTPSLLTVAFKI